MNTSFRFIEDKIQIFQGNNIVLKASINIHMIVFVNIHG